MRIWGAPTTDGGYNGTLIVMDLAFINLENVSSMLRSLLYPISSDGTSRMWPYILSINKIELELL